MESNITIFENPEFGNVRIQMNASDEPMFCALDVCNALGYSNNRDAISKHVDEDDVAKCDTIDSLGRTQQVTYVTESGMYSLIFGSKVPKAKAFKKWVTSEVLPSIRKTGGYVTTSTAVPKQEQKPASLNEKMKTATWAAKFLNMNDNSKLILAKPILEQVGLPIPDYTPSKGVLSSAKELLSKRNIIHNGKKLTTKVLNEILEKNGIIRTLTRKTSKGQDKPFKNITEKGSVYGENQVSQYDARETQPLWFVEKFDELLKAVGLQTQSELF